MMVFFTSASTSFLVPSSAEWPSMLLRTDATGEHRWTWSVRWGSFNRGGEAITPGNEWDAKTAVDSLGGELAIRVSAGTGAASINAQIRGTNPSSADVVLHLSQNPLDAGF